jgi:cysteinyl-tRNA synthetase
MSATTSVSGRTLQDLRMGTEEPILLLYDTLHATKRPLELREPGKAGIYCCGPTVYDMSHVGHARAALAPDVLVRFLRQQGVEVEYVRNVTDIDDKIIKRAAESGTPPQEVAQRFLDEYHRDLGALGMLPPDVEPKVSGHIEEIVALIAKLVDNGLAYAVGGDVYYEVARFAPYGQLSKRDPEELRAGARIEVDERKRAPGDFALWKAAKPGEPSWPSPWGAGRPGWHIECSAMSARHLGETFDIHTGGLDLVFPHHENEIAQSQGVSGEGTFARHWMHNGFVNFAGEKMSKSLGNFFTIREVTALYHPEALRYFLIAVHYRRGVNFDVRVQCPACDAEMPLDDQSAGRCGACGAQTSVEALRQRVRFPGLEEADERVAYVYETLQAARAFVEQAKAVDDGGPVPEPVGGALDRFVAAMRDDLNTAAALGELSEPLGTVNRLLQSGKGVDKAERARTIARFLSHFAVVGKVLGCFEGDPDAFLLERRDLKAKRIGLDVARVEQLVAERNAARAAKDWPRADALRAELTNLGVEVRDGKGATAWTL